MNRDQKAAVVEEIAAQIQDAEAVFAVDYRGISVPQAAELRARLRDADATFRVVKNSLTERAADKAGASALQELLDGPTAFTFVRGDAAVAAKALADFGRAARTLAFKGGLLGEETLTADQINSIARLPARDQLHAQLVGMVASPITGVVRGLNALIAGVAIQLSQIAEQGLVAGEPAADDQSPPAEDAPAPDSIPEERSEPTADSSDAAAPGEDAESPVADEPDQDAEPPEDSTEPSQPEGDEGDDPTTSDNAEEEKEQ